MLQCFYCFFLLLFNVCIINTMRVNEEEVKGVSDALPSTVSNEEFQHQVAMSLVLNPAGTGRKRPTKMEVIGSKGSDKPEHYWVKLDRKKYCQVCHIDRERRPRGQREM